MKKESVIIWGIGTGFFKREKKLQEKYTIIGFTGNCGPSEEFPYKDKYIAPRQLVNFSFDKIIVCSLTYYETIKYQLINVYGVSAQKIQGVESVCKEIEENEAIEKIIYDSIGHYNSLVGDSEFQILNEDMYLITYDYNSTAGIPHKYYFAQDIWAARKICRLKPEEHIDIGSRLDGFIGHLLAGLGKVKYIDIRPLPFDISGLEFIQGDATNLDNIADNSVESLSSLHAVEHFGLGRYGDLIDPNACFKAMNAFQRILKPGGHLYFAVPIGPKNKLCFNAHRIFNPNTIISTFRELELKEFSVVIGDATTAKKVDNSKISEVCCDIPYNSCGLFEFVK